MTFSIDLPWVWTEFSSSASKYYRATIMAVVAARMSTITTPPTMAHTLSELELAGLAAVCGGGVAIDIIQNLSPGTTGTAEIVIDRPIICMHDTPPY